MIEGEEEVGSNNLGPFVKENKDIEKEWIDKSGFLRLRPDHLYNEGGMDGFFAAILKKKVVVLRNGNQKGFSTVLF